MDGARNLVVMNRETEETMRLELKKWTSITLSGCLEAKVGGTKARLETADPIKKNVCWKGKRTVLH